MDTPVTLITGTRKGIGRHLAEHYVRCGHRVVGCSRGEVDWAAEGYVHYVADVPDEPAAKPIRAAGQDRSPAVSPGDPAPRGVRGCGQRDRLLSPKGKLLRDRTDPVPGRRVMREPQPLCYTVGSPVVLIALVGLAVATLASLFDGSFVQNDSAQYVSMAENLRAGYGVATSLVWTEEHLRLGSLPVVQINLPPGYPILIALVGLLGVDSLWAAFLVSMACFSAIPFLIYRILRTTAQPSALCLALSGAWLVFPVGWCD